MKKLTIITKAPGGTLGDPGLCKQLIDGLLRDNPSLEIDLVVHSVNTPGYWKLINKFFAGNKNVVVYYLDKHANNEKFIDKTADAIIFYPFFVEDLHHIAPSNPNVKPILLITHYNDQVLSYHLNNLEHWQKARLANTDIINTGIGLNRLGINIIEPQQRKKSNDTTIAINENDSKVIKKIFGIPPEEELKQTHLDDYSNSTDLYFGYYNNLSSEVAGISQDIVRRYIELSIKASREKIPSRKKIDIVLPLKDDDRLATNINNIIDSIKQDDITIEYWSRDTNTNELILRKKIGTGSYTVRLINAFPLDHSSMHLMYGLSEPLTLVTGNSSLSEAISYEKVFLYQVMKWHTVLDEELLQLMRNNTYVSSDHPYVVFNGLIREKTDDNIIFDYFVKHYLEIQEGARIFKKLIAEQYNLSLKLPAEIVNRITKKKEQTASKSFHNKYMTDNPHDDDDIDLTDDEYDEVDVIDDESSDNNYNYTQNLNANTAENLARYQPTLFEQFLQDTNKLIQENKQDYTQDELDHLLMRAFIQKNHSECEKLLTQGANPNCQITLSGNIFTPYHIAAHYHESFELLEILFEKSKSFDLKSNIEIYKSQIGDYTRDTLYPDETIASLYVNNIRNPEILESILIKCKKLNLDYQILVSSTELTKALLTHQLDICRYDILVTHDLIDINTFKYNDLEGFFGRFIINYPERITKKEDILYSIAYLIRHAYHNHEDVVALRKIVENTLLIYANDTSFLKTFLEQCDHPNTFANFTNLTKLLPNCEALKTKINELGFEPQLKREEIALHKWLDKKYHQPSEYLEQKNLRKFLVDLRNASISHVSGTTLLFGESAPIKMSEYNFVRKKQIEAIQKGFPLRNTFLRDNTNVLKHEVLIGNSGEAIFLLSEKPLAEGEHGKLCLGVRLDTCEVCAIKVQKISPSSIKEKEILLQYGRLFASATSSPSSTFSVYQYDAQPFFWGDNLKEIIEKNRNIPEDELLTISLATSLALKNFHDKGFLHRDVRLANFIWDEKSKTVAIVDLGDAAKVDNNYEVITRELHGMLLIRAPELDNSKSGYRYNEKTEVYSLGVVLAILNSNQTSEEVINKILQNKTDDFFDVPKLLAKELPEIFEPHEEYSDLKKKSCEIIRRMCSINPDARPTMAEVVESLENFNKLSPPRL